ncbi:MAG TPA: hypothetical protein VNK89_01280 [Thermoflexus sp.]|nr:hypothetical protein [Thermoflexus sp.]
MARGGLGFRATWRVSAHAFTHPAIWISVFLLLLNDHVLKFAFPSFWTGKLSDFAWLFFAPFLLIPLMSFLLFLLPLPPARLADLGYGAVGVGFAALKLSPTFNAWVASWASAALGRPTAFALDPTDGMALLALIPSRWLWDRIARTMEGQDPPRGRAMAMWILAMLASLATPPCPPIPMVTRVLVMNGNIYLGIDPWKVRWVVSADGGATWRLVEDPPPPLRDEPSQLEWPILRCLPEQPSVCYRIPGPGRIEKSEDGGRTWRLAWMPPRERESFRRRFLVALPARCSKPEIDEGPYDLAPDVQGQRVRWIVAMGTEGIMFLNPDGSWQLRGVEVSEPLSIRVLPTPYAAEHVLDGMVVTLQEFRIVLTVAILSYLGLSYWRIRRLKAWLGPVRPVSPVRLSAGCLGGCLVLGIGMGISLVLILMTGSDLDLGSVLTLFALIILAILFHVITAGYVPVALWPLNAGLLIVWLLSILGIWRTWSVWRGMRLAASRPAVVQALHRATILVALGICIGAWGFFIAWAMGWIPRYELALALASGWIIGLWIAYLRWRPELGVLEAPERVA